MGARERTRAPRATEPDLRNQIPHTNAQRLIPIRLRVFWARIDLEIDSLSRHLSPRRAREGHGDAKRVMRYQRDARLDRFAALRSKGISTSSSSSASTGTSTCTSITVLSTHPVPLSPGSLEATHLLFRRKHVIHFSNFLDSAQLGRTPGPGRTPRDPLQSSRESCTNKVSVFRFKIIFFCGSRVIEEPGEWRGQ